MDEAIQNKIIDSFRNYFKIITGAFIAFNIIVFFLFEDLHAERLWNEYSFVHGTIIFLCITLLNSSKMLKHKKYFFVISYIEIGITAGLALYYCNSVYGMIYTVVLIMLMLQTGLFIDSTETFVNIVHMVTITIILVVVFILIVQLKGISSEDVIFGILIYGTYIATYGMTFAIYGTLIQHYEKKIFSQARLLEEVNTTNDKLVDNQEKINRTNEQLGIQKVKLQAAYNKINRINSEMVILNDIIKCINESLDINVLIQLIADSIINDIGIDVCAISIEKNVVHNDKKIVYVNSKYSQSFADEFFSFVMDGGFPEGTDVMKEYVDNQIDLKNYTGLNTNLIGSMLVIPLISPNGYIGRIYAGHSKYDYFGENIPFYQSIVAQFLIGIKNIQMFATMEDMAIRDALTGIYNRRQLNKMVNDFIEKSKGLKKNLTSVLIDIDKFKNINDSYGHLFGDKVIKGIAELISLVTVGNEEHIIAARYGGEEFVIVFDDIPFEDVCFRIKELHDQIKDKEFENNGEIIHVNVSIGIASYPATCDNPESVLNRSDWAMYYSKQNGRGRITIDSEDVDKLRK